MCANAGVAVTIRSRPAHNKLPLSFWEHLGHRHWSLDCHPLDNQVAVAVVGVFLSWIVIVVEEGNPESVNPGGNVGSKVKDAGKILVLTDIEGLDVGVVDPPVGHLAGSGPGPSSP